MTDPSNFTFPPLEGTSGTVHTGGACPYCSGPNSIVVHGTYVCPRVKAIEYHPDGTVKRVEFRELPS